MHLYDIVLVVGIVTASTAKQCCMPDKFEMVMAQTIGYLQHGEPGIVQGVAFTIRNGMCTKGKVGPYQAPCVPATAKFVNRFTMGEEGSEIYANAYQIPAGQLTAYMSVTDNCIVLGTQVFGSTNPTTASFSNIGYQNVTIGIRDPSVFVVPKICNEGSAFPMEKMPDIGGHNIFLGGWSTKKMNNKM